MAGPLPLTVPRPPRGGGGRGVAQPRAVGRGLLGGEQGDKGAAESSPRRPRCLESPGGPSCYPQPRHPLWNPDSSQLQAGLHTGWGPPSSSSPHSPAPHPGPLPPLLGPEPPGSLLFSAKTPPLPPPSGRGRRKTQERFGAESISTSLSSLPNAFIWGGGQLFLSRNLRTGVLTSPRGR